VYWCSFPAGYRGGGTRGEGCSWYDQVNLKSSKPYFIKFIDSHHLDHNKASELQKPIIGQPGRHADC